MLHAQRCLQATVDKTLRVAGRHLLWLMTAERE